jgi:hypothetical protein
MIDRTLWTTTESATWWGVKPGTFRDYVSKGYAPSPVDVRDPVTGSKMYDAAAVRAAFAARPGQGARTDVRPAGWYEWVDWYAANGAQATRDPWRWRHAAASAHADLHPDRHPSTLTREEVAQVWLHAEADADAPSLGE